MRKLFIALAAFWLFAAGRPYAAGFNPGEYPGVISSGATLVQSGVISTVLSNYAACEFFNNTAAPAYFVVYNSATVAGQAATNIVGACEADAGRFCSVGGGGPSGPSTNAAIVGGNGLSWFGSSTFPTQTGIGANGWMLCTVNVR